MLKIVQAPNPVLSQEAREVKKIDKEIIKLLEEMSKTLLAARDPIGVGLAAPQVGESLRIFIAKPTPKSKIQIFINPRIEASDKKQEAGLPAEAQAKEGPRAKDKEGTKLEGCLSLQNIWGEVKRDEKVTIEYQQLTKNHELITKISVFSGFMATVIQHEMDHLYGILFPKRVLEQKGPLYKSSKNDKGEDIFEEIEV